MREKGALLLVDAGNALFHAADISDAAAKQKALLILQTMGELGTVAMAAGARDLNEGVDFLKTNAAKAKVTVLSANLQRSGKSVFPASLITSVGGARVGLIGVSPQGKLPGKDLEGAPAREALLEARRLRPKVDLVLLLAAIPYADVLQLSKEGGKSIDFILHSNDARGAGPVQNNGENYIVPTGERGRQLGELEIQLTGRGTFVDLSERQRSEQMLSALDRQIGEVQKRQKDAAPATLKVLKETESNFQARKAMLQKQLAAIGKGTGGRTFLLRFETLGPEVPDDPALKDRVSQLELPALPGPGTH